jgi:hypothetical protein
VPSPTASYSKFLPDSGILYAMAGGIGMWEIRLCCMRPLFASSMSHIRQGGQRRLPLRLKTRAIREGDEVRKTSSSNSCSSVAPAPSRHAFVSYRHPWHITYLILARCCREHVFHTRVRAKYSCALALPSCHRLAAGSACLTS